MRDKLIHRTNEPEALCVRTHNNVTVNKSSIALSPRFSLAAALLLCVSKADSREQLQRAVIHTDACPILHDCNTRYTHATLRAAWDPRGLLVVWIILCFAAAILRARLIIKYQSPNESPEFHLETNRQAGRNIRRSPDNFCCR